MCPLAPHQMANSVLPLVNQIVNTYAENHVSIRFSSFQNRPK